MEPGLVVALCTLAGVFQSQSEVSMGTLLARTGYTIAQPIPDEALEEHLRAHPELINDWLIESRNTRESPAWYLLPPKTGSDWIVSHYPEDVRHSFPDKFKACAFYIRVYVMQLASLRAATYSGRPAKFRSGQ